MKYQEEYIAQNLFQKLTDHFKNKFDNIDISIEGAGVHWNCKVALGDKKCKIHCFEFRNYDDIKPQYLISFEVAQKNVAWGRTYDINETINSTEDWVMNQPLVFLYQKYEFVDQNKRSLEFVASILIKNQPELSKVTNQLVSPYGSGLYNLSFIYGNRACKLSGYVKEIVSFEFFWDDCRLFEATQKDIDKMALAIKKWLIDEVAPTKLENELPWIEVGQLAKYYEKGEGIKGEFIESWNGIEKFYNEIEEDFAKEVLLLIKEIRKRGFDEKLRAGQSLYTFMLSRARRHGLDEQNFLALSFYKNKLTVSNKSGRQMMTEKIEYSHELEKLLINLAQEEII